ncbi:MAG: serine/threonine protein kinase [Planctomycetes bacterium]|nr:serine/threonine protein kinase [Planctomycetota bacterium]
MMDPAEPNDTPEQAVALAREVVRAGLADKATAMRLVQEHVGGPRGSFGALLVARGVVDREGLERLQAAAASASATAAASSPSMWLPARPPSDVSDLPRRPPSGGGDVTGSQRLRPQAAPERESGRLRRPAPEAGGGPHGLSERTLAFDAVLRRPGDSGSREFDPIVADAMAPDERLESTASSSRDAAQRGVDLGVDSVAIDLSSSGEELATQPQPKPGDRLGEYVLEGVLGSGGMGVIHRARREGADGVYAVKILMPRPGPAGEARRQRFAREVEVLRRLEHPNIVRIHDAGRHGAYDWYAMDFVEGRELGDLLAQGRLTLRQRLDMFSTICRAVAHAHERGVVHRDLKPGNVLIDPGDVVHVLDFGLAKVTDAEPTDLQLTHDGSSLGTPYYMAPEQLVSPKDVDRRADVFALGVLLYELTAGARPFVGNTAVDVSNKILNVTPPPPSTLGKDLPPAIDAICLKALQKGAADRYQDVDTLRREVDRVRKALAPRAPASPSGQGDVVDWLTRNRDGVIVGFVLATLVYVPLLIVVVLVVRLLR